jgi:hypothetical protein
MRNYSSSNVDPDVLHPDPDPGLRPEKDIKNNL